MNERAPHMIETMVIRPLMALPQVVRGPTDRFLACAGSILRPVAFSQNGCSQRSRSPEATTQVRSESRRRVGLSSGHRAQADVSLGLTVGAGSNASSNGADDAIVEIYCGL